MSLRSRMSTPRSSHSTSTRDAALRRLSLSTRWLIAGSVALTGALSEAAAHAFPGKTVKVGARRKAAARHHHHSLQGSASSLRPPAQAPRATQTTPETHTEAAPERAAEPAPERSAEPTPEAAPERAPEEHSEAAPEAHSEAAPEAAPEVRSEPTPEAARAAPEGPVISGGS
jgi:outer membrane biosynthesis protein TonB